MVERLVVKVVVETPLGEILAVRETRVRDDLLTSVQNVDREQNTFQDRVAKCAAEAYREAVGK